MATKYKHYIQKQGDANKQDIETEFNCLYKEFNSFFFNGDIKNIYTEDYAEQDGVRIYCPPKSSQCNKTYDCELQLLFDQKTCQDDARRFYEYIAGQIIEYSDTFRNRYVTLVLSKRPSIKQEKLYGNRPYMLVSFTFTNITGKTFETSQLT